MTMVDIEKRDIASSKEGEAWGTLEELLLACAVSRHGTKRWDFIAVEVQKRATFRNAASERSSNSNFSKAFTPHNCEQRYNALKCRFDVAGDGDGNDRPDDAGKSDGETDVVGERDLPERLPFMIDELRKLRVEELRREVERHDVSIVSLQLKVKRLEEERERSSLKADQAENEVDLRTGADRSDAAHERRGRERDGSSGQVADRSVFREPSGPENRSLNKSNSTSRKTAPAQGKELNRLRKPNAILNGKADPVRPVLESEPDKNFTSSRRAGRCGFEGEKVVGRTSEPVRPGNPGELEASVSESKREVEDSEAAGEAKQSSDVQSSASLPRRRRRGWRRNNHVGSCSNEIEVEELSPANKRMDVKSQPLIKFLEIVRSHKHGLVFQRRLPSQETQKYRKLIRQHMDIQTVESNLERGVYCDCHLKFYRDLLLIFTNALLFFRKTSTEHLAARDLSRLVTKEIAARKPNPGPETRAPDPYAKNRKPPLSTDIVVCRRRRNAGAVRIVKEEEEEVENAGLRSTKRNAKDEPMKLKRERSNLRTTSNEPKRLDGEEEQEQGVTKRKRMKQNSPSNDAEEESIKVRDLVSKKKIMVGKKKDGAANARVSGRRSMSATTAAAKKKPGR